MVACRIQLLDGTDYEIDVDKKANGEVVFDAVCEKLNLVEKDYFGLTFLQSHIKFWMSLQKQISKQIKKGPWIVAFELKFYPDPMQLHEEITRYQVVLQVRRDILTGKLPCSFITLALLSSYAVQSQVGDYNPDVHFNTADYIKAIQFSPTQNDELLEKIAELHRTHKGLSPSEAELYYLDNAKTLALYGVHMHEAKDSEGDDVNIGVCSAGLLIYKDRLRIHRFTWPKILKIRYKRNNFHIDIRPDEEERKMHVVSYKLTNVKMAKRLWRIAVEHHAFFRLREPEIGERSMFSRSPYRYSGRTQYQSQRAVSQAERNNPEFNRVTGSRFTGSRSMDNLALGYSTERWEKHVADVTTTATLDIRRQNGSMGDLTNNYNYDPAHDNQVELLVGGGYDGRARYNNNTSRSVDGSQLGYQPQGSQVGYQPQGSQVGYRPQGSQYAGSQAGYRPAGSVDYNEPRYATAPGAGGYNQQPFYGVSHSQASVASQDPAGRHPGSTSGRYPANQWNGGGGRMHSRPESVASDVSSLPSAAGPRPPRRKRASKGSQQSSRTDHSSSRGHHHYPQQQQQQYTDDVGYTTIADADGDNWTPHPGTSAKTSTRTYVAQDGTVITEYRTERNGVIETHIEKRTRVSSVPEESDVDYDKELTDAIFNVTKMNPDLTVQKIEIHTRSEEV